MIEAQARFRALVTATPCYHRKVCNGISYACDCNWSRMIIAYYTKVTLKY